MRTLLLALLLAGNSSVVSVRPHPSACFAPCSLELRITYEHHPANKMVAVLLEGNNHFDYGEIPLHESTPAVLTRKYHNLPAGEYAAIVVLVRHDGRDIEAGRAKATITITGD